MTTASAPKVRTVPPRPTAPPAPPPVPAVPAAPATEIPAELVAALIRVVQATLSAVGGMIGRSDMSPNGTLVRLGAHREDVETLRAFLASQPRPAHIPPED